MFSLLGLSCLHAYVCCCYQMCLSIGAALILGTAYLNALSHVKTQLFFDFHVVLHVDIKCINNTWFFLSWNQYILVVHASSVQCSHSIQESFFQAAQKWSQNIWSIAPCWLAVSWGSPWFKMQGSFNQQSVLNINIAINYISFNCGKTKSLWLIFDQLQKSQDGNSKGHSSESTATYVYNVVRILVFRVQQCIIHNYAAERVTSYCQWKHSSCTPKEGNLNSYMTWTPLREAPAYSSVLELLSHD